MRGGARRGFTRAEGLTCVAILVVIAAIAIPNLIEARKQSRNPDELGALRTIHTAQTLFREGDKEVDKVLDYGNLQELSNTTLIDAVLGSGTKQGYVFDVRPSPTTGEFLWFAVANPCTPGATGERYYCTNHSGVIYYTLERALSIVDGGDACAIPPGCREVGK